MHDELVYALLALFVHWWLGWRAMKSLRREAHGWRGDDEVAAVIGLILFGSFIFLVVTAIDYYQNHGSIFADKFADKEEE